VWQCGRYDGLLRLTARCSQLQLLLNSAPGWSEHATNVVVDLSGAVRPRVRACVRACVCACARACPPQHAQVACFPKDAGLDEACFKISYDLLIVGVRGFVCACACVFVCAACAVQRLASVTCAPSPAPLFLARLARAHAHGDPPTHWPSLCLCAHDTQQVGSVNNTFGIQGVKEHCMFFKSIEDANALRRRVSECFERAALPYVSAPAGVGVGVAGGSGCDRRCCSPCAASLLTTACREPLSSPPTPPTTHASRVSMRTADARRGARASAVVCRVRRRAHGRGGRGRAARHDL
jgi:hypothetical protein